ncbi:putative LRR receptor-like serine/threonine-protein kinase [Vitis vinifera]|uniref:non-specific serine/threonine protein kinase n=1 Tax=Vitis vinifera TaxID=29760 RepID=A0A438FIU8_VITVI|nr:putative LRR receptor-like serine/threonine-protein kinase [Vitis vinifera]
MHLFSPYVSVFALVHCWVACFTPKVFSINLVDEFALIALKAHITYDSQGILATNWSTKSSHCSWYGISCNAPQQRVSAINLSNMGLEGTIAPQVGNLSFLISLDLSNNYFYASLPKDIGKCKELQQLNLFNNKLVGSIPEAICNLPKLEELYLGNNHLIGEIPKKMSDLLNLKILSFPMNNLTGSIPATIFNLSSLLNISLSYNSLSGSLPMDICNTNPKLKVLNLSSNHLSGQIPNGLGQCIKLQVISLSYNEFTGSIPRGIGELVELQRLSLRNNSLTGGIPKEMGNLRNLNILSLTSSGLSGPIPVEIFNISSLEVIDSELSGHLPATLSLCGELLSLSLFYNKLAGSIPREIGNLSKLEYINLNRNSFAGSIPPSFGNLTALQIFIGENNIQGSLPSGIGTWLPDLEGIYIEDLGNLRRLQCLNLAGNQLTDEHSTSELAFLTSLTNCNSLRKLVDSNVIWMSTEAPGLYISQNRIHGSIPSGLCHLTNLGFLDLSSNKLLEQSLAALGILLDYPTTPRSWKHEVLSGIGPVKEPIFRKHPKHHTLLQNLLQLYLSHNKLQGHIPPNFGDLVSLVYLDLSANNLSGSIPKSLEALKYLKYLNVSFNKLQGEIPNGGPFAHFTAESFISNRTLWSTSISSHGIHTKSETPVQVDLPLPRMHRMIPHQELLYATSYFGEDNLIGKGSLGMGAFKSFEVECEVMRNIRHRNLAKIISSCSNLDFKALMWHQYLHHDYSNPVVHCDLKPSNVLLDDDMVAHISDFGIAKLLIGNEFMKRTKTLGTIGYMAPEYGSEGIASTKGDIYSYGIMLMETFVGKKPTDEMFMEELTLKSWVESSTNNIMELFSSIMTLALDCAAEPPEKRINMKDVVVRLKKLLNQIVDLKTP